MHLPASSQPALGIGETIYSGVLEEATAILDEPDCGRALRADDTGLIVVIAAAAPMLWITAVCLTVGLDWELPSSPPIVHVKSYDRSPSNVYLTFQIVLGRNKAGARIFIEKIKFKIIK